MPLPNHQMMNPLPVMNEKSILGLRQVPWHPKSLQVPWHYTWNYPELPVHRHNRPLKQEPNQPPVPTKVETNYMHNIRLFIPSKNWCFLMVGWSPKHQHLHPLHSIFSRVTSEPSAWVSKIWKFSRIPTSVASKKPPSDQLPAVFGSWPLTY